MELPIIQSTKQDIMKNDQQPQININDRPDILWKTNFGQNEQQYWTKNSEIQESKFKRFFLMYFLLLSLLLFFLEKLSKF